jgi:two-component system heavy metal sensor histidine kinase CusS
VILSRKRTNEDYTDILYSHLEDYERMSKMVSDMLLLAQTEHGLIKPNNETVAINQENEESALSTDERAELIQLRKDKKRLEMEREILKKASAFFAKEMK